MGNNNHDLDWLEDLDRLAEEILSQQTTSACDQIHPIIQKWYLDTLDGDPPYARPSEMQALACLTTEIMSDMPEALFEVMSKHLDEDEVALWVHEILTLGRAFEQAVRKGDLDDL
ncbi:MAG: hypothetical protein HC915_07455 [Anaerolineae bacterium]|nr:hypothetical protein [Anaerolineae bacterium]